MLNYHILLDEMDAQEIFHVSRYIWYELSMDQKKVKKPIFSAKVIYIFSAVNVHLLYWSVEPFTDK
jgi:hypothetical protein